MPTPTKGPRLGGGPAHERLLLAGLATALLEHDRITTTEAKAKRLRPLAERLVTFGKRGDLAARRRVLTVVRDKGVVHRLFTEIAPDMAQRPGGYTRITKIGPRKGDNAPMAVIELVREPLSPKKATVREAEAATRRAAGQARGTRVPEGGAAADVDVAGTSATGTDTRSAFVTEPEPTGTSPTGSASGATGENENSTGVPEPDPSPATGHLVAAGDGVTDDTLVVPEQAPSADVGSADVRSADVRSAEQPERDNS